MHRDTATFRMSVLWNLNRKRGTLKLKRNFRGLGLYVVIFLIIILGWYSFGSRGIGTNTCTQAEFEQALKDDKINSIVIKQNEEVPTGTVTILLKDGTRELMNV